MISSPPNIFNSLLDYVNILLLKSSPVLQIAYSILGDDNSPQNRTAVTVPGSNSVVVVSNIVGGRYQITIVAMNKENLSSPQLSTEYHHGKLRSVVCVCVCLCMCV